MIVEARQHQIEDDDVVGGVEGKLKTLLAIAACVNGVPQLAQAGGQGLEQLLRILNDEQFHGRCRVHFTDPNITS